MRQASSETERLVNMIADMSREDVKREISSFQGSFSLDFPEDYLERLSLERLRHILLAAKLQQRPSH